MDADYTLVANFGEIIFDYIYVDDNAPNDPEPWNPDISDPDEDGSPGHPFDTIQEAKETNNPAYIENVKKEWEQYNSLMRWFIKEAQDLEQSKQIADENDGKEAFKFLVDRQRYEYESFKIKNLESVD